jgi:hypothetical protein
MNRYRRLADALWNDAPWVIADSPYVSFGWLD